MQQLSETAARQPIASQPFQAAPLTYTLNNAAAACGLSRSTLYRHAAAGRLQLMKVGGRTLVNAASLRALVGA
jgi:excisionase family DNA binding protein